MASLLIHSLLKATTEWLSLIRSTRPTSPTTTTVADDLEKLKRLLPRIRATLLDAEKMEIVGESVKLWLKEIKDVAYDAEDVLEEYNYHVLRAQVENRDIAAVAVATEASMKMKGIEGEEKVMTSVSSEASRKRKHVQVENRDIAAAAAGASMQMKGVEGEEEVMPSASSDSNPAVKISILNSLADKIKSIRKRFKEISKDRHDLHLKEEYGEIVRGSRSEYPPPTSHMIVKQEICGRDDDKRKLIDWLFSNMESKFEVLAVVGKGGLGKTTLAQLVYNDQEVSDYFEARMWICVSEYFDVTRLTREMVESITRKNPCTSSDQLSLLQESLHEELQGRRVLLVLDDVWDDKKEFFKASWESLRTPLKENGAEMVRIIVTTRIDPVAEIMQTRKNPYRLGHMPEDQCWELFKRHAFCGRDPEKFPSLVAIGEEIVKKCDGLPLSVKALGGLLQHERDEDGWKDILQSRLWELDTEILPALKLGYIRMPSHLKPCFEICSIFPKDYKFSKDELVKLWAANGYIQQHNNNNDAEKDDDVHEKGYKYFKELRRRSFFDEDSWAYKMHDNIHDLAHYVLVGMDSKNYEHKTRHLAIKNESFKFNPDDFGALRTLIVGGREMHLRRKEFRWYGSVVDDVLGRNITRLTQLRYLAITHNWSEDEPLLLVGLGNLISLRYLELCTWENLTLPKSIGQLYNLVVLDITCHGLVELPEESFRSLVSLTTIRFIGFSNDQLPALGQLLSLRSLQLASFDSVKCIGNEFYRGQNNKDHPSAAFPSLTSLKFAFFAEWKKWGELQEGDFPRLQKLEIASCDSLSSLPSPRNLSLLSHVILYECESLQLSPFPPNLKILESVGDTKLRLSQQEVGELKKLESLRGKYWVRNDQVLGILNNLPMSIVGLNITGLNNVHNVSVMEAETNLKSLHRLERLTLKWIDFVLDLEYSNNSLWLVVEDDNGDGTNQTEKESFFLLEKLQPHTNLEYLDIMNYGDVGYPRWIGHHSFDRLSEILLESCINDQLPTLGQLPSLQVLSLSRISKLKKIGDEFCRDTRMNNDYDNLDVSFPSLTDLYFIYMTDWEEWYGGVGSRLPSAQSTQYHKLWETSHGSGLLSTKNWTLDIS